MQVSKRVLSAREKGRKGGLATARNNSPEFLEQRASNAGSKTRDTYGIGFYRYIRTLRGKVKTPTEKIINSIIPDNKVPLTSTDLMIEAGKTL